MAQEKIERLEMRVSREFLAKVDDWRRDHPAIPSRAEAIRQLVEQALRPDSADRVHGLPNRTAAEGKEFADAGAASPRQPGDRAAGDARAADAAIKRVDEAQSHEAPGGRKKRKRALTEIPGDLLGAKREIR